MCILFIGIDAHPVYPLIICANRDEFYARPTAESGFWQQNPDLLAGRDLQAGGSWMGITRQGRIAALTNIRDPQRIDPEARTRGELVTDFLHQATTTTAYAQQLHKQRQHYNGYNLLFGHWRALQVYNNHLDRLDSLKAGFHGLSNAELNSPWPKLNRGVKALREYCSCTPELVTEDLFRLLQDQTRADDHLLPQTGIPLAWERDLSSIFIHTPEYGTRTSTLLTINHQQQVNWHERTFDAHARQQSQQHFSFSIAE